MIYLFIPVIVAVVVAFASFHRRPCFCNHFVDNPHDQYCTVCRGYEVQSSKSCAGKEGK